MIYKWFFDVNHGFESASTRITPKRCPWGHGNDIFMPLQFVTRILIFSEIHSYRFSQQYTVNGPNNGLERWSVYWRIYASLGLDELNDWKPSLSYWHCPSHSGLPNTDILNYTLYYTQILYTKFGTPWFHAKSTAKSILTLMNHPI